MLGCDVPTDYTTMVQYAMALSRATVGVPEQIQGSPENVIAVMTIARAINLPIATVLQNVFSHEKGRGQVGERSKLVHMLARRAGHRLEIENLTDTECEGVIWLHDQKSPIEVSYTLHEARLLGLLEDWRDKNRNWQKQPANMLRNRWITRAVDWHCPEVKMGADFSGDGDLYIQGLSGEEEEIHLSGVGPEVSRILDEIGKAAQLAEAGARYARLRGIWVDARMLRDTVLDDEGGTLEGLLSAKLAEARQDAQAEAPPGVDLEQFDQADAAGERPAAPERGTAEGKRKAARLLEHSRAQRELGEAEQREQQAAEQAAAVRLPCGCSMEDVTRTGSHSAACADLTARLLEEGADRR
jgi:hypothetical protein